MAEIQLASLGTLARLGLAGSMVILGGGCDKVKELTKPKPVVVAPSGAPTVRELSEADYPGLVATPGRLTVVVFHASWCGPCKQLAPVMEKVAGEFAGVAQMGRFDVDQCPNLTRQLGVSGIPDVRFFLNGKQVDSFIGGLSESDVRDKFKAYTNGLVASPNAPEAPKTEPTIQRMPKDWMPPGLKRG